MYNKSFMVLFTFTYLASSLDGKFCGEESIDKNVLGSIKVLLLLTKLVPVHFYNLIKHFVFSGASLMAYVDTEK